MKSIGSLKHFIADGDKRSMEERKTILIIEDDTDINGLLDAALSKAGYGTAQAYSGTESKMLLNMKEKKFTDSA